MRENNITKHIFIKLVQSINRFCEVGNIDLKFTTTTVCPKIEKEDFMAEVEIITTTGFVLRSLSSYFTKYSIGYSIIKNPIKNQEQ